jgi:hypothetical protein
MEERIRNSMGILPNTRWIAGHLTKTCARKLALLETFITFQLRKEKRFNLTSKIKSKMLRRKKMRSIHS